jgi:hypothetical protein
MRLASLLFLMLTLCAVWGFAADLPATDPLEGILMHRCGGVIPDVMGRFPEVNAQGEAASFFQITDQFSAYPGWPITQNSVAREGGIYCQMDADPQLEIVYHIGNMVYAWNLDGSPVPGWPQSTANYYQSGAPAYGDIDGDGVAEIVVQGYSGTSQGYIYAFELNGTAVPGFPINHGYSTRSVVLADLDNDNALEIITNKRLYPTGEVWVYRGNGTVYPGWPKPIDSVPSSSSAVGDINNDGSPEIVAESYNGLHVWDANGNPLPGFPFMMPYGATNSYSSPVLVDLNNDGYREIIFGTHGAGNYVFVLRHDGSNYPGWPLPTTYWIYSAPAVGYIDGDNILDIAVGDQVLSSVPSNKVYAWNANGVPLAGFPIQSLNSINSQIVLADLDHDGMTELIIDDNTTTTGGEGKYLAFNHDGTPLTPGWPLIVMGYTMFNNPALGDLNLDGYMDMLGAGSTTSVTNVYAFDSDYIYSQSAIQIPMFQYNVRHDGLVPQATVTPPDVQITMTPQSPPIVIPAGGGSFNFDVNIANNTTSPQSFAAWIMVQLPNQSWYGPVLGPVNLTVPAGAGITRSRTQSVPGGAPAGNYLYEGRVGVYPSTVWDASNFPFSKAALRDAGNTFGGSWSCSGERFPGEPEGGSVAARFSEISDVIPVRVCSNYSSAMIRFDLPAAGRATLEVYDVRGCRIAALKSGWLNAGAQEMTFDGSNLPSGVYFARMTVDGSAGTGKQSAVQKLVLMK